MKDILDGKRDEPPKNILVVEPKLAEPAQNLQDLHVSTEGRPKPKSLSEKGVIDYSKWDHIIDEDEQAENEEMKRKDISNVKSDSKKGPAKRPKIDVIREKGNKLFAEKDYQGAIELYSEAISEASKKLDPKSNPLAFLDRILPEKKEPIIDHRLYCNRAICYFKLQKYQKCIEDCNEGLKMEKNNIKAYWNRR